MYNCLIVSLSSSPSLCLALRSDGSNVTKTSPNIGAIKDISTSMSGSFSQPLFLQKPEICPYNPTQLYLQEEKQKFFISVKLSTPHTTSFVRVFDVFGMVRRKLISRHSLWMNNFDRKRSRFKLNFEQQEHPKQYQFFMPSSSRVNVVSPVKADSHITT